MYKSAQFFIIHGLIQNMVMQFFAKVCYMFTKDGNFTCGYGYPRVLDLTGTCMGMKFYLWVVLIPDPTFGGHGHGYCLPPAGNPWISEIKIKSFFDPAGQHSRKHSPSGQALYSENVLNNASSTAQATATPTEYRVPAPGTTHL
jgi:hypothetical protein